MFKKLKNIIANIFSNDDIVQLLLYIGFFLSGGFVISESYAHIIWKIMFSVIGSCALFYLLFKHYSEPREYHIFKVLRAGAGYFNKRLRRLRESGWKDKDADLIEESVCYFYAHSKAKERVVAVFGDTKNFTEYYRTLPPYYAAYLLEHIFDHKNDMGIFENDSYYLERVELPDEKYEYFYEIIEKLRNMQSEEKDCLDDPFYF